MGLPNVSRIILGDTPIAPYALAQSIDVGNFLREETALFALTDLLLDFQNLPRSATATLASLLGRVVGTVAAHEAGHFFGAFHQDNTNGVISIMDAGGGPFENRQIAGVGLDGIFGTADDENITFGVDAYDPTEPFTGFQDTAAAVAIALSTGGRGGLIHGYCFQ